MDRLVAVDWGTSALRGVLLDAQGALLAEHRSDQGILKVAPGQFASVFEANFGDWMRPKGSFDHSKATLALVSGMAGSQQGWAEAAYCPCPAGFGELAGRLHWVQPQRVAIVPGLCCEHQGLPDVMRGEEVQVFGALQLLGAAAAGGVQRIVLPGTHSKWVRVQAGRVLDFRTYLTGEVFALLRHQSILARTLPPAAAPAEWHGSAFDEGVAHALASPSLLGTVFSTRSLALFGRRSAAALESYLSGLVIGDELRAATMPVAKASEATACGAAGDGGDTGEIIVIGSPTLTARYTRALAQCGLRAHALGAEATWHGLQALARQLVAAPGSSFKPHE